MSASTVVNYIGTANYSDQSDESIYEMLANYMTNALENTRGTLSAFIEGLSGAEKAKVAKVKEQVEDYLEKLDQSRKANGLQKFFKALGILGFILAIVAAVFVPTPMTIGLLVVATAMFLEPLISNAAGSESILESGMKAMFEALNDAVGPVGAAILASVIMLAVALLAASAVAAGVSMMTTGMSAAMQAAKTFLTEIPAAIGKIFSDTSKVLDKILLSMKTMPQSASKNLGDFLSEIKKFFPNIPAGFQKLLNVEFTATQTANLRAFLEFAQSAVMLAQAGVQIDLALVNLEIAKLMKENTIDQAIIDEWSRNIQLLYTDTKSYQDMLSMLEQLTPRLFDR